jgi:hypothetical protein
MSKYANEYRNAESIDVYLYRSQYAAMMKARADIEQYGANLLSMYRARKARS